jgi:glutamyl-tRNA synthetase
VLFSNAELDDLIIRRSDGSPTYNLSVVVDDHDMGITHVIRGDDHINNTPRQINLFAALGWDVPAFGHVPMILGDDGARLSKRHGAVSVMQYRDEGYLPEALLNYLVRLGWSHGDQELFTREQMIELFDLDEVNRSPSAFNTEKLVWINQQYIKEADTDRLAELVQQFLQADGIDTAAGPALAEVIEAQRERAGTLVELAALCHFYYRDFDQYAPNAAKKAFKPGADEALAAVRVQLEGLAGWERAAIHQCVADTVAALDVGFGKVAMPLRIAVTGGTASPDLDLTLALVGREATLRRIDKAIAFIQAEA